MLTYVTENYQNLKVTPFLHQGIVLRMNVIRSENIQLLKESRRSYHILPCANRKNSTIKISIIILNF